MKRFVAKTRSGVESLAGKGSARADAEPPEVTAPGAEQAADAKRFQPPERAKAGAKQGTAGGGSSRSNSKEEAQRALDALGAAGEPQGVGSRSASKEEVQGPAEAPDAAGGARESRDVDGGASLQAASAISLAAQGQSLSPRGVEFQSERALPLQDGEPAGHHQLERADSKSSKCSSALAKHPEQGTSRARLERADSKGSKSSGAIGKQPEQAMKLEPSKDSGPSASSGMAPGDAVRSDKSDMRMVEHYRPPDASMSASMGTNGSASAGVEMSAQRGEGDQREPADGVTLWLHVYDLGPVTGQLNETVLRGAGLGAFHCGVEVLGDEWSFQGFHDAWDDPTLSGVVRNEPRRHPEFIYRESINMGTTPLEERAVDLLLDGMMESWPANGYHIVSRNCVTFSEEFLCELQCQSPFPVWVRGAIDAGKSPAAFAVVDYGWSWFKWWCQRQAEQEAAEAEAEAQARRAATRCLTDPLGAASLDAGPEGAMATAFSTPAGRGPPAASMF